MYQTKDRHTKQADSMTGKGNGWGAGEQKGRRQVDEIFLGSGRDTQWSVIKLEC